MVIKKGNKSVSCAGGMHRKKSTVQSYVCAENDGGFSPEGSSDGEGDLVVVE